MAVNLIVGNDGSNNLQGGSGDDLIYGFNPNGPQGQVASIAAARVASGLNQPVFVTAAAGDADRLFIVEKEGIIKILDLSTGQVFATPFLNITSQIDPTGEQGLLGMAFDPNFRQNGYFYVNMINLSGDTEIRRFQVSANPSQVDPATSTLVLSVAQPDGSAAHKAGWLGFGPDGYLYAALGDGGSGGLPSQEGISLLGKILRLDVTGTPFRAMSRATMPFRPTTRLSVPPVQTRSMLLVCAIRFETASTADLGPCTLPMLGKMYGRR
jgi:glucose/arabinose dehydrogenase